MRIHSTKTQIQKMILCSKTGFKRSFKRFLLYKINSDSNLVWLIQLISIEVKNSLHTQHEESLIALAKPTMSQKYILYICLPMIFFHFYSTNKCHEMPWFSLYLQYFNSCLRYFVVYHFIPGKKVAFLAVAQWPSYYICIKLGLTLNSTEKRYLIIDQQIVRHFVQYRKFFQTLLCNSNN